MLLFTLNFSKEYASITAMLCAKFKNDLTTEMDIMDEWDLILKNEFLMDILYSTPVKASA